MQNFSSPLPHAFEQVQATLFCSCDGFDAASRAVQSLPARAVFLHVSDEQRRRERMGKPDGSSILEASRDIGRCFHCFRRGRPDGD